MSLAEVDDWEESFTQQTLPIAEQKAVPLISREGMRK